MASTVSSGVANPLASWIVATGKAKSPDPFLFGRLMVFWIREIGVMERLEASASAIVALAASKRSRGIPPRPDTSMDGSVGVFFIVWWLSMVVTLLVVELWRYDMMEEGLLMLAG